MVVDIREFESYITSFNKVLSYFEKIGSSDTYPSLCKLRVYQDEEIIKTLKEVGFVLLPDTVDLTPLKSLPCYSLLGLETKTGRCLLEGRYVFPVRDMMGNILALIGWYPDEKKYITTPSKYFNRSALYFGLEQVSSKGFQDKVFICEGIFDAISLRSLGYVAYATMGVSSSLVKRSMYNIMGRTTVGVSDRDSAGRGVRDYDKWSCSKYLTWVGDFDMSSIGEENIKVKDIDDLIKLYEPSVLKEVLDDEISNSVSKIIKLYL